jgi:hypothetical protein
MLTLVIAVLLAASAAALVAGLFRPALVVPGRNRTKVHAVVLYGAATLMLAILLTMSRREPAPAELRLQEDDDTLAAPAQPPAADLPPAVDLPTPGQEPEPASP